MKRESQPFSEFKTVMVNSEEKPFEILNGDLSTLTTLQSK
jgi:hypothetical protein